MDWHLILSIISLALAYAGYNEKRLRDMQSQVKEMIENKNELNRAIQTDLKERLGRLEDKLDMLIRMNFRRLPDQSDEQHHD